MDIERWLQGTADAEEPDSVQNLDLPLFLQPRHGENERSKRHRRKRKHASSDSSLLQAKHGRKSRALPQPCVAANGNRSQKSASSLDQSDGESCDDTAESQLYKRRFRRKTRPDRYDPKPERTEKAKPDNALMGKGKGKKRRRSRIKERRDAGVMQSFQSENMAKKRLTLKPQDNLGVFKRGRASSPVRGRGVPDLTFSEMRFLQKRQDPRETEQENQHTKRRKPEAARIRQDEISSYFTAKRPGLTEQDVNIRTITAAHSPRGATKPDTESVKDASIDPKSPRATIQLPDKPFLGFGSRAPPPQSSYNTWSESVRRPSALPYVPTAVSAINVGALQQVQPSPNGAWNGSDENSSHVILLEKAPSIGSSSHKRTIIPRHQQKPPIAPPPPQGRTPICSDLGQRVTSSKCDRPKLRTGPLPPQSDAAASPQKQQSKASASEIGQGNAQHGKERNDGDYKQPKQSSSPLQKLLRNCDAACSIPHVGGQNPPRSVEVNSNQRTSRHTYPSRQPRASTTHAIGPHGARSRSASSNVYFDQTPPQDGPDEVERQHISPWELKNVCELERDVGTTYNPLTASPYVVNAYDVLQSALSQWEPDEEPYDGAITDADTGAHEVLEDEGHDEAGFAGFWRPHKLY